MQKVIISIRGGCLQEVLAEDGSPVEVGVIDYDSDDSIIATDGKTSEAFLTTWASKDLPRQDFHHLWGQIEQQTPAQRAEQADPAPGPTL